MNRSIRTALWVCGLLPVCTFAGHGFSDAFADIEWLPPPGVTPADVWYPGEKAYECARLYLAGSHQAEVTRLLAYARERLAETVALVRSGRAEPAAVAAERYRGHVKAIRQTAETAPDDTAGELRQALAEALLEHQYMLSVEYPELPADGRQVLADIVSASMRDYAAIRASLPQDSRDMLYFKQEEAQWSWEVARKDSGPDG